MPFLHFSAKFQTIFRIVEPIAATFCAEVRQEQGRGDA